MLRAMSQRTSYSQAQKNDYDALKGVIEFMIGLRYESWFSNERFHALLEAGWEEQLWISNSNFFRIEENAHGDMTLHGLTIKARFDF